MDQKYHCGKNHNLGGLIGAQARLRIGVRIPSCIGVAVAVEWANYYRTH